MPHRDNQALAVEKYLAQTIKLLRWAAEHAERMADQSLADAIWDLEAAAQGVHGASLAKGHARARLLTRVRS